MRQWRDRGGHRSALLMDGLEEGRPLSSASEIENDRAIDGLEDRVSILKRLTADIHEEVESHSELLDRMGSGMDSARGMMGQTMDRFRQVIETKSGRNMLTVITSFVVVFILIYYMLK